MRLLIITAVQAEADAIGEIDDALIVAGGIGRTNAAAATTQAIIESGPFDAVISAGVAGALPESNLTIGDIVVATACIYAEEGLLTPEGFQDMAGLGFALGDFPGNEVPVDGPLLRIFRNIFRAGPIATVATCSGTDAAAAEVARRTGALVEAMEGAAVVHAARRLGLPGIEIRAVSNTTGDRADQAWDLARGLSALGEAVRTIAGLLRGEV
jgi:futalosine hydrolase